MMRRWNVTLISTVVLLALLLACVAALANGNARPQAEAAAWLDEEPFDFSEHSDFLNS